MNLYDKIEEIRRKPEHIRVRYVWACVAVSMFMVLAIWALSIKSKIYQYKTEDSGQVAGQSSIFDELKEQKSSLDEYQQQMTEIKDTMSSSLQEAQNQQNISEQIKSQMGTEGDSMEYENTPNSDPTGQSSSDLVNLFQ